MLLVNTCCHEKLARHVKGSERGMASVVFVALVSLALATTSVGLILNFRSSEQMTVASNALTHSQNGMWLGAEAFRLHLQALDDSDVDLLHGDNHTIAFSDTRYGEVTASNISVQPQTSGGKRVSADIANVHAASRTSSAIRVVYHYQAAVSGSTPSLGGATPEPAASAFDLNFDGDVDLTGGISLTQDGNPIVLNVTGSIVIGNTNLELLESINATGDVTLKAGVRVNSVFSNGDVSMTESATAGTVQAVGSFTSDGGGYATNVFANGDVSIGASGRSELVDTRGSIVFSAGSHGSSKAGGTITNTNTGSTHDSLQAVGDISIGSWERVESAISMSNISCQSQWWNKTSLLSANGTLSNCPESISGASIEEGASNTVDVMAEIQPRSNDDVQLDVWSFKDEANYFIEWDDVKGEIKVSVNNINGIEPESVFYIGDHSATSGPRYLDYLCSSVDSSGMCDDSEEPLMPLCVGFSLSNNCISYDESQNKFTLNPADTAPGVMLFDGDLLVNNGHSTTTLLATGDISTAGSVVIRSPNYGSYEKVCEANGDHFPGERAEVKGRFIAEFSQYYPSNLCDVVAEDYLPTRLGNIGLASGGIDPDSPGTFEGGVIDLGASTNIVGAVLAGDVLTTVGNVTIRGVVSTAGEGSATGGTTFNGLINIDSTSDVDDYNPNDLPDLGAAGPAEPSTDPVDASTTILWVRSL